MESRGACTAARVRVRSGGCLGLFSDPGKDRPRDQRPARTRTCVRRRPREPPMPLPYITRAISRPFRITTSAVNPRAAAIAIWMPALALTVASAIYAKEAGSLPPLLGLSSSAEASDGPSTPPHRDPLMTRPGDTRSDASVFPSGTRWFDGRHVRPARVIIMRVTAYSPDARSCGKFADGQTATLNSVWTNAMRLVAADTDVLPISGRWFRSPGTPTTKSSRCSTVARRSRAPSSMCCSRRTRSPGDGVSARCP